MTTDKTLVLVGCAHVHLPDHLKHAEAEGWRVTAVHDRDARRRETWARELQARPLESLEALAGSATAALVCSETVHHEADIAAALEAGLPVFSEKPLAADAAAAERLVEVAKRTGGLLDTAYFMRTIPALAELRRHVQGGAIGQVIEARGRFAHDGAYAEWLDLDTWMTVPALASYGGFADEGVHVLDWLLWTLGPAAEVRPALLGHACGYDLDDHGAGALRFEEGATAAILAGWTDTRMRLEFDLVGTDGGADLREGTARLWRRGKAEPEWTAEHPALDAGDGIRPFLASLADGGSTGLVPPEESARVNSVMDRFYGRA